MSDVIKLLPDSVANQIAAGEVIQRPASVIKELVENGIDAGATSIEIILKDAGRTLIQVIDNGCGMSDTDARLAFERHSTSKIKKADDLFTLNTMGFRGEALASIAAIAQVELRTQKAGEQMGTQLIISASTCESQEPIFCTPGSNFLIKNIFFNVPARRKFLKNNQVELSNIVREFEKLALVNHNVEFTLIHNDNIMSKLMSGNFKQRIVALFGRTFESQLIPVSLDTTLIRIEGFVSKPENARKRNPLQFLFVNGRFMRHQYFHKAIVSSYQELIPDDEQPNYFLNFSVNPETIDVNIHPTKTEIKFENEQSIWQIISAAVKETLGRFSVAPTIDFDTEGAPDIPVFSPLNNTSVPPIDIDTSYNPFNSQRKNSNPDFSPAYKPNVDKDWESLYRNFEKSKSESLNEIALQNENVPIEEIHTVESKELIGDDAFMLSCLQLRGRYILSPVKSGLMIVDQHRAHIRILFDKYMLNQKEGSFSSQRTMFPEVLHLSSAQNLIIEELEPEMQKLGFDIAFLGDNSWSINGLPTEVEGVDVKDLLLQVIDSVIEGGNNLATRIYEHIALIVARSAAIPYGRVLSQQEMETLLSNLLSLPKPNYTPDGKTIISVVNADYINNLF
ncbi:MAG: DNA mismatch repair endonuclease MutL [Muribaculaceae bacterium]